MKRKTITLVVYMLVCISLVSVGFAAWVITGGTTQEASAGITASTVTDKSINIEEIGWTQGGQTAANPKFVFGYSGTVNETYAWLFYEEVEAEKLEATYSFKIKVGDSNSSTALKDAFTATGSSITLTPSDATLFNGLVGAYIASPVITYTVDGTEYTTEATALNAIATSNENEITVAIEIVFDWGTITGGENPYKYFNGLTSQAKPYPSADDKTKAYDFLDKISDLNGVTYNLNIVLAAKKTA